MLSQKKLKKTKTCVKSVHARASAWEGKRSLEYFGVNIIQSSKYTVVCFFTEKNFSEKTYYSILLRK